MVVGILLVGIPFGAAHEARAIDNPLSIFTNLFNLVSGPIGTSLTSINKIVDEVQQLNQQIVWPLPALNKARGFVATGISKYRPYSTNVFDPQNTSAPLAGPPHCESALDRRSTTQIPNLQTLYSGSFGTVPASTQAAPKDRVMIDMDDALAQENLKTTIASDQAQDQILATANAMENQVALSTPGSTPFFTAQAQVANLRSQAYIQKMLAAELRQEAGRIAHDDALAKSRAQSIGSFGTQIIKTLSKQ